ncbi:nitroreductase family protein [Treponema pedis]|uniref:nitroreductase family protein n=1 Tax=Treponema pedis TaxID=409322 RepID=UPI0004034EB1|nr:nitroreductase family protein [Treponema pedis]
MTSFLDLAKSRHSVRHYENKPVETEKLNAILEAGRIAPTAANQQPCRFLVLSETKAIEKLQKACTSHDAPLVIIVYANKKAVWVRPFDKASMADIDTSIACDHMRLCAQDLGLSSCWITYFKPDIVRKEFNIPDELIPVNILAIGYGSEPPKPQSRYEDDRNPIEDIVQYSSY